jgi:hypothetical protein
MPALTSEIFGLQHFASNYCLVQARARFRSPRLAEESGGGASRRCLLVHAVMRLRLKQ